MDNHGVSKKELDNNNILITSEENIWKVLIVNIDQNNIEKVKKSLENYTYQGKKIKVIEVKSHKEAKYILIKNRDILISVVGLQSDTEEGKDLIKFIRSNLENDLMRILTFISDEVTEKCASAEAMILLQKDEDCYWYIDTLNHYFNSNTWDDLQSSKKYKKIKQYIDKNLYGYSERRVREKYIWLQKELKRIEREKKYLAPRGMMGVRGVSGALWYMMAEEFHEMEDEDE